jgi:hypothetical protein
MYTPEVIYLGHGYLAQLNRDGQIIYERAVATSTQAESLLAQIIEGLENGTITEPIESAIAEKLRGVSARAKLAALGLTDEEITALVG